MNDDNDKSKEFGLVMKEKINLDYKIRKIVGKNLICFICGQYHNSKIFVFDNGRFDDTTVYIQICQTCLDVAHNLSNLT